MRLQPKDGEKYECYWRVLYNGQDIGSIENYEAFNIKTLASSMQKIVDVYNSNHTCRGGCSIFDLVVADLRSATYYNKDFLIRKLEYLSLMICYFVNRCSCRANVL